MTPAMLCRPSTENNSFTTSIGGKTISVPVRGHGRAAIAKKGFLNAPESPEAHLTYVLLHGGWTSSVSYELPGREQALITQQRVFLHGGNAAVQHAVRLLDLNTLPCGQWTFRNTFRSTFGDGI